MFRWGSRISRALPWGAKLRVAEALADRPWRRATEDRLRIRANLGIILGRPVLDDSSLVREVYRNFARYLVEFAVADRLAPPRLVMTGGEAVARRLQACRGAVALTAHLGNWELGAIGLRRLGVPVTAVALPHHESSVNGLYDAQRRRCGVEVVPVGRHATARALRVLRRGEVVAVVADRDFGQRSVEVSFFGRQTSLPRGPAILSLRAHAPILPSFLIREGRGAFRLFV